jgi:hypothetical protein
MSTDLPAGTDPYRNRFSHCLANAHACGERLNGRTLKCARLIP